MTFTMHILLFGSAVAVILNLLVQNCVTTSASEYSTQYSTLPYHRRHHQQLQQQQEISSHRFKSLDRVLNRLERGGAATSSVSSSRSSYNNSVALAGNSLLGSSKLSGTTTSNSSGYQYKSSLGSPLDSRRLYRIHDDDDDDDDGLDDDDDESYEDDTGTLSDKTSTPHWSYSSNNRNHAYRPTIPASTSTSTTTTTTTTTTTPTPPGISYSQYKWQNLGSRPALEHYRRQTLLSSSSSSSSNNNPSNRHHQAPSSGHSQPNKSPVQHSSSSSGSSVQSRTTSTPPSAPDTSIREAINHALKVSREGSCRWPKPRLVRVNDFYPHPGKTYVPHCTILHQCSDDTGCCRHDVLTCSPKTTQRVELSFYTLTLDSNRGSTVERLVFYNHTECECRDRSEDLMPRDVSVPAGSSSLAGRGYKSNANSNDVIPAHSGYNRLSYAYDSGTGSSRSNAGEINRVDNNINLQGCKCPSAYTERILPDTSCTCDCFDREKECLKLKKGRIFFTMQDKWCIQSGRCEIPGCAYGAYIHLIGRCPRKKERYGPSMSWHRYLTQ